MALVIHRGTELANVDPEPANAVVDLITGLASGCDVHAALSWLS